MEVRCTPGLGRAGRKYGDVPKGEEAVSRNRLDVLPPLTPSVRSGAGLDEKEKRAEDHRGGEAREESGRSGQKVA